MMSSDLRKRNESVLREAKRGDRLKFERRLYSHWGVYTGDEEVVHLTGINGAVPSNAMHVSSVSGAQYDKAVVKKENFWEVAGESSVRIDNTLDADHTPLPREHIVKKAMRSIGKRGYNILHNNCEHFTNRCRYGVSKSKQVVNFGLSLGPVAVSTIGAVVVALLRGIFKLFVKN